ncbi:MAG: HD domain-containing protein [Vicinamibacterales bacterium]
MARLPRISEIDGSSLGNGFFLCARKERRTGRGGVFLVLLLQDASGEIDAKIFQDVDTADPQFDVGEFVAVQGKGNLFNNRLELIVDKIRRIIPEDSKLGFREEDCIPCSPRPIDEMWAELDGRLASIQNPHIRDLLLRVVARYGDRLKIWPAARQVHHAYRSGLLEHVLKIMDTVVFLAGSYGLRTDLVIAGALLHDIGKLEELRYQVAIDYSVEGNLVGHIVIGAGMLRDMLREMPEFPPELALEIEHLILSHHGSKEMGSPVKPMTAEALILAAADDLDAKLNQVRRHLADDATSGRFTTYHRYLDRVLLKPS